MKSITKLFLYLLLTFSISVQSSVQNEYSSFSVIGNNNVINKPGAIELGFKFALKDGWHTYWLNAGDSGGPAVFEYKNNSNLVISDITWPGPQKIPYPPLMTYGFKNDLVIPFKLTLNNLEDSQIEIKTKFLVCDDICIPQNDSFSLELKNGILNVKQAPNELLKWKSLIPARGPPVEIVFPNQNGALEIISDQIDEGSYFYPYMDGVIDYSVAQKITIKNQTQEGSLALSMLDTFDGQISGVISSKNGFSEINETIKITPTVLESSLSEISLITALLFAFIGGLILNLMPCVLPVIALKAFSLIKNSQNSNSSITLNASLYVFGVLATFLGIAGILIALKGAGENIGWGYQLQSPMIVGFLSTLMFVIGLILFTDIDFGSSLTKLENLNNTSGASGSFLTGVLSVLVASPCTAPFMGAALGYALVQSNTFSMLIFLFLGLGFALPYFLIAIFPRLVEFLPKPGEWMKYLKQFFSFLMFGTAIWLFWVLSNQVETNSLLTILIVWLVISFFIWFLPLKISKPIKYLTSLVILFSTIIFLDWGFKQKGVETMVNESSWTKEREISLRNQGSSYFINFTAAWCITCQVNERVALTERTLKEFDKRNIKYFKADWTNRSDEIFQELKKYGRSGVPVYVFWNKNLEQPIILNEVLTEKYVMEVTK